MADESILMAILQIEIDNAEALRLQTLELKNSINNQSNEKFKEIEEKLKMLTEKE